MLWCVFRISKHEKHVRQVTFVDDVIIEICVHC